MRELIRNILQEVIEEKDTEKFIKCRECKKKFTQTIHKGKKSLPICPYCGAHNTEKKEVHEQTSEKSTVRRHLYSISDELSKVMNLFHDGYASSKSFCKAYPNVDTFKKDVKSRIIWKIESKIFKGDNRNEIYEYADQVLEKLHGDEIHRVYNMWCNKPKRKQIKEGLTDYIFKKLNIYPFKEYQKFVDKFLDLQKLKIEENVGILNETHFVKPSGEVVIKVKNYPTKEGKVIFVSWKLLNDMESYISAPTLVICVAKWVEKKLKLDNIKGWEIFLD